MWQTIIVLVLVGLAALYVAQRIWRTVKARSGPACGCAGPGAPQSEIGRAPGNDKPAPPSCCCS